MTKARLIQQAQKLRDLRTKVLSEEETLGVMVNLYLDMQAYGARELAKALKFTPAYISDIRHGRRKISEAFLNRLLEL